MFEGLSNELFLEIFATEMRRRSLTGLVCCIDVPSTFIGVYPKEWNGMEDKPLAEQLQLLAAFASINTLREKFVVGERKLKIVSGGRK